MVTTGLRFSSRPLPSTTDSAVSGLSSHLLRQPLPALLIALAASGLAELFLQRVVYRVGVHIPRDGAFLETYQVATWSGDFVFRLTAVLLVLCSGLFALRLLQGDRDIGGALLSLLLLANALIWPLHSETGRPLAMLTFLIATGWVLIQCLSSTAPAVVKAGVLAVAGVLILGQYQNGLPEFGLVVSGVSNVHLAMEAGLIAAAYLLLVAASRAGIRRRDLIAPAVVTLLLAGSYFREPSTVAIVSLWATGVTLSLPPVLYLSAFAAGALATMVWARSPQTRNSAVAIALLLVAGVQPQVAHHEITALIALMLLALGFEGASKSVMAPERKEE